MPLIHYTREPYAPHAACQWNDQQILPTTKDITKVECKTCLSAIIPAKYRTFTLEELRERALKYAE